MKTIHAAVPIPNDPYTDRYFSESSACFDIETTGFSPANAFVYLIGTAFRRGNEIHLIQYLAQNRTEEIDLLTQFHRCLEGIDTLITFNGLGFDIPFLKSREQSLGIVGSWDAYQNIDLYKLTGKFAHLFQLPNKKQKSLEQFLGIERDDKYHGGELISVYFNYEKQQDRALEELLLLHNYEDVLGMTRLLSLLSYREFWEATPKLLDASLHRSKTYGADQDGKELLLTLKAFVPFPKRFLYSSVLCSLSCSECTAKLLIPVTEGELKFYYDNYKDYYYLPKEDIAVHKSVAAFVDPAYRKKAAASTCYTKKPGSFLPQAAPLFSPCFYPGKKSAVSYFELTNEFLSDETALRSYAIHLLDACMKRI